MQLTVNFLAQVKEAAGTASKSVEIDAPCSIERLLRHLADSHGEPLSNFLVDAGGHLKNTVLIIVGDDQVPWDSPVELKEGDVVTLLSPIAGG